MRGGYEEENKGTWINVVFNDADKEQINDYYNSKKNSDPSINVMPAEIITELFPNIGEVAKRNAVYKIQQILGFGASDR